MTKWICDLCNGTPCQIEACPTRSPVGCACRPDAGAVWRKVDPADEPEPYKPQSPGYITWTGTPPEGSTHIAYVERPGCAEKDERLEIRMSRIVDLERRLAQAEDRLAEKDEEIEAVARRGLEEGARLHNKCREKDKEIKRLKKKLMDESKRHCEEYGELAVQDWDCRDELKAKGEEIKKLQGYRETLTLEIEQSKLEVEKWQRIAGARTDEIRRVKLDLKSAENDFEELRKVKDGEIKKLNEMLNAKILDAADEYSITRARMAHDIEDKEAEIIALKGELARERLRQIDRTDKDIAMLEQMADAIDHISETLDGWEPE